MIEPGRLLSRSATYLDPTGSYVAEFGLPWRRVAAAAIDWTLCYVGFVLVSIPLGAVEGLGAVSREEGDLGGVPGHVLVVVTQILTVVPVIAYFGLLLPTSNTYGMRALGLRLVSLRTGRAPSYVAASIRGVAATALAASFYASYLVWSSFEKPHALDDASSYALTVAHVLVIVGAGSALAMILTPTHRSLIDRLFGTGVLDNVEAVAPRMGPWGPLDSFDLSSRER
ncbi:MAG TPA: RDD family protein [Gaiellaceae bacterium]